MGCDTIISIPENMELSAWRCLQVESTNAWVMVVAAIVAKPVQSEASEKDGKRAVDAVVVV